MILLVGANTTYYIQSNGGYYEWTLRHKPRPVEESHTLTCKTQILSTEIQVEQLGLLATRSRFYIFTNT